MLNSVTPAKNSRNKQTTQEVDNWWTAFLIPISIVFRGRFESGLRHATPRPVLWDDLEAQPLREMIMFTAQRCVLAAGIVLAVGITVAVDGDDSRPNPAAIPLSRDNARHQQLLKRVAKSGGDVVFLGDSITERWESTGVKAWNEVFVPLKAVNLGVGGDQTGHVLWRLREGKELEPLSPKVAVVLIGINNPVQHLPEEVAGGVQAIVAELKKQKPEIKVLVLGVLPCSLKRQDKTVQRIGASDLQPRVKQINAALAKLHDGKSVFFKDIGDKFLEEDGGLSQQVMSDYLHLGPKGYQIWADAIKDDVLKLLK